MRDAWSIAVKDATETWRDGRFRWLAAAILVLLTAALVGGAAHQAAVAREHADAQRAERDRWLGLDDLNPHAAAHYGTFVFKPVEPLAAVDPGLDPFTGASVFLEAHQQQLARHRAVDDTSPGRRMGELSAALALQLLVPLLILSLAAGAVAGERERGTWRIVHSLPVAPASLAAGKLLGIALPLTAVLLPATMAGGLVLVMRLGSGFDREVWLRLGLLVFAYAMYFAIWIAVGLFVSTKARSARAAFLTLVALWFLNGVAGPPLAMAVARSSHPAPSALAFTAAIDDERALRPGWDAQVESAMERFLAGEDLPPAANPEVVALIEAEEADTALYERHFDRLFAIHAQQAARYEQQGLLLPHLAMQSLSMGLAATDHAHARHFLDATREFRSQLLDSLNAELASFDGWRTFSTTGSRELWASVPEFDYDTPPAAWAARQNVWSLGVLSLWLALAVTAALRAVAYDAG